MALPVPVKTNKDMTASVTAADFQVATVTTIVSTPAEDGYVEVMVGGVQEHLGDGVRTASCYFSDDAGATAKAIEDITAGDTLYWVGSVAGYELDASMKLDFNYIAL